MAQLWDYSKAVIKGDAMGCDEGLPWLSVRRQLVSTHRRLIENWTLGGRTESGLTRGNDARLSTRLIRGRTAWLAIRKELD